jgi:hypothetical protein
VGHSQNKGPRTRLWLNPALHFRNVSHPWTLRIIKQEAKVILNLTISRLWGVRRGRFLHLLHKSGGDLTTIRVGGILQLYRRRGLKTFHFSTQDIHSCKVPFKYIQKFSGCFRKGRKFHLVQHFLGNVHQVLLWTEFSFWELHGTFPILTFAGLNLP